MSTYWYPARLQIYCQLITNMKKKTSFIYYFTHLHSKMYQIETSCTVKQFVEVLKAPPNGRHWFAQ